MKRGTRVGQAYVALAVDGTGINEEIADELDQIGPEADRAGDDAGDRFGTKFSDRFRGRMDEMREKVAGRLNRSFGDAGDKSGEEFADRFEKHFDSGFLDRLGANVGGHIVDAINFALSKEGGENPLSQMADRWEKGSRSDTDRLGKKLGKNIGKSMSDQLELSFAALLDSFEARLAELQVSGNRGGGSRDRGLGDRIGGLFGAGSRNNFLNLFGKSLGGLVTLTEKLTSSAGKMFGVFRKGFSEAAEGASFFQKIGSGFTSLGAAGGSGLAKAFSSIAASGPAAAAAIGVVVVALSAMVSVVSALTALVTALASAITSGLVAALAVGSAGILAVVAAGGLLINMFTSLTDAQREAMGATFTPLKELLTGIGQIMAGPVIEAFDTWARNLNNALTLLIPLAQVMGDAFARAGNILTASFSGPGFQRLSEALTDTLPTITRVLSRGLGDFLNGLAGTFAALMPFVVQFSRYLADVADRFSKWANSAQGQNAIVDFTKRATDSLQSLWNFVREFTGFLADVLFSRQAQESGGRIFDGMAETFRKMRDAIAKWAKDGTLEKWFKRAESFGKALWQVVEALFKVFQLLDSSGVLKAISFQMQGLAVSVEAATFPLQILGKALGWLKGEALGIPELVDRTIASLTNPRLAAAANTFSAIVGGVKGIINAATSMGTQIAGSAALDATSEDRGGRIPKNWKNPYTAWAESLIKNGPSVAQQIRNAIMEVNRQVQAAIREAMAATDAGVAKDALKTASEAFLETGKSVVDTAQQALNSAAQSLASATSAAEAQRALRAVRRAQRDLKKALDEQKRLRDAARILNAQQIISPQNVERLLDGLKVQNATLADYARARERLAIQIENAQRKLEEAISLRNDFRNQIAESVKAYGSLVSAQAQTINGVAQALTADDVISNLQTRLDRIKAFQDGLRELTARGLSDAAYKQLLEAGVEGGFDTVQALLNGGQGAVQQINDLLGKIGETGDSLGQTAADKLYQAGVDAAQGLVDGLNSLDDQLEAAATRLGNRIADAVKAALGIKSPSTVLIGAMNEVGDGAVIGLDNQHGKISAAGSRFGRTIADSIAVSPEVAAYQAAQRASGVSGNGENGKGFRDLIVQTPTEDPRAVALETLNEVMGRL